MATKDPTSSVGTAVAPQGAATGDIQVSKEDQAALDQFLAQQQQGATNEFSGISVANIGLAPTDRLKRYGVNPAYVQWQKTLKSLQGRVNADDEFALQEQIKLYQDPPAQKRLVEDSKTVDDLIHNFINSGSENIEHYQQEFEHAGLLEKDKYTKGFGGDESTLKTMEYAYWYANQRGIPLQDAIKEMVKFRAGGPASASGGRQGPESASEMATNEYKSMLVSKYLQIWGVPPPSGYIERAMHAHMNVFEFEANEKNKPAYEHSPDFQYNRLSLERQIASTLGSLG